MKKILLTFLVVAASALCCTALAQDSSHGWVKNENNPVFGGPKTGTMFDANVITEGKAKFNMYVSWRPEMAIALTYSDNGVNWSDPIVVLRNDPTSGWEDNLNRSCTLYWNGQYHMWYTGQARGYSKIGYAISYDGINFRRVTKMPVLIPEYPHEGFSVMNPYVIRDEERGVFRMWYASGETFEPNVLCYAESSDGIHWDKSPLNPIYVHGEGWEQDRVGGCEVHKMDDGRYALFYIGYSDIHTAHIGVAFSEDGITGWERYEHNPIVVPEEGSWDAAACYKPTVYRDAENNMWHLWYNGRTGGAEYIGYVTHEGLDITK